jgi:hypothetical protein
MDGPAGTTFGPGTTQTWTYGASDATSGLAALECSVVPDGAEPAFGACSPGSGTLSVSDKPDGHYVATIRATDAAGQTTLRSKAFSIDATAPQTSITGGPANDSSSSATSATFKFAASESGSTFECRVYPAALTPGTFGPCTGATSHTASGFSAGTYAFEVRATDAVGNVDTSPAKRTFTVTSPPPSSGNHAGTNGGDNGGTSGMNGGVTTTTTTITTSRQIVNAALSSDYDAFRKYTRFKRLALRNVPAGAKVTVTCKGKKCPAKRSRELSKFAKKKLGVGTNLTIRVTKPGAIGKQFVIKIRSNKRPGLKISQIL